ncbi:MAG: hypothetical protein HY725_15440 [Candidatus Rokubacteria bacterium]|nr:hypothetical protein [Candidatus Rokubacteria bacterium]
MRIPEQIRRLSVVVLIIVAGLLLTRYLVPASLVKQRVYRAASVKREIAREVRYAGGSICINCHEEVNEQKKKGYHKTLACETCHGPSAKHTEDPSAVKPFAPRERKFCPLCHEYNPSRPTGFPQITATAHNPLKPCITCHNPHDPVPPQVPRECSACHAEIARTKALSRHALLECTTCHTAPPKHKQIPRSVRPTKPESREFCAKCHDKGSPQKTAPKVDAATHGERYLCWECHYPHMPGEA